MDFFAVAPLGRPFLRLPVAAGGFSFLVFLFALQTRRVAALRFVRFSASTSFFRRVSDNAAVDDADIIVAYCNARQCPCQPVECAILGCVF